MEKPYEIKVDVDDDHIITISGKINPKYYQGKPVNQIWSAFYKTARQVVEAWETYYNERYIRN